MQYILCNLAGIISGSDCFVNRSSFTMDVCENFFQFSQNLVSNRMTKIFPDNHYNCLRTGQNSEVEEVEMYSL